MKNLVHRSVTLLGSFCVLLVFTAYPQLASSAVSSGGPPVFVGQVVIQGGPDNLPPEYQVLKVLPHANLTVVKVEPGKELGHIKALQAKGLRAGLNLKLEASVTVNDPLYVPYQWHFSNIQSESAWEQTDGSGVTVAVLDSGLATDGNVDGIDCVTLGYDVVDGDATPTDGNGHGTHVTGTIAQKTNNGTGAAGLAYGACIMPVKILDDDGSGSSADIADGIYYAVMSGADVINMSLGTNARFKVTNDLFMDDALDHAYENNVTVICAAGNDASRKNVSYPAIYPTTIAVGAVGYDNSVTSYSNKGTGLDVVAPGGNTSQDLNGDGYGDGVLQETILNGAWGYYFMQGTSMASPHVAAVAAMLIAKGTAVTPAAIYEALTRTALDLGESGYDTISGYGLVQATDALNHEDLPCSDNDSDGFTTCTDDCDDSDPGIYPGADEICGDGIDQDCNGVDPPCECLATGDPCDSHAECCSGRCHPIKGCK